jgi:hypothetical protein
MVYEACGKQDYFQAKFSLMRKSFFLRGGCSEEWKTLTSIPVNERK